MFPFLHQPHCNAGFLSHFRLGQVGFNAFQEKMIPQGFGIDRDELPGA